MNDDDGGMRRPPSNLSRVFFSHLSSSYIDKTKAQKNTVQWIYCFGLALSIVRLQSFSKQLLSFLCRKISNPHTFSVCPVLHQIHAQHRIHSKSNARETKPKSTRRIPFHLELLSNCSSGFESTVQTYVRNLISVFSPAFVVGFQFQYPKTPYKFRLINVLHAVSFAHITSFIFYGCVREINACHMFMKISECVLCAVWNMRYTNGKSIYRCSCIDFCISSTSSR